MNGGGGENGGDPGQGRPVTGPHRSKLLAKLQTEQVIKQSSNQSVNNLIWAKFKLLAKNLMGVNNEKEPLSGTTPESRLFDRSLCPIMQLETFHFQKL